MPSVRKLIAILEDTRRRLDVPDNDFTWSSWEDRADALTEIDGILASLKAGALPYIGALFAPTGPIQEVSISSGWPGEFAELADRYDEAMAGTDDEPDHVVRPPGPCGCFSTPWQDLATETVLGLDNRFAEVSVLRCPVCGQHWLRYFYENEAFTGSGRWYLGAITEDQLASLTLEKAKATLEELDGYFFGGSYFEGRPARSSGPITLSP